MRIVEIDLVTHWGIFKGADEDRREFGFVCCKVLFKDAAGAGENPGLLIHMDKGENVADWKRDLKADPTDWLLERAHPPVRYGALRDLLDLPPDDPQVGEAKAGMSTHPPVAELLSAQKPDGNWGSHDYYLPRAGRGTFWVLSVLGDFGFTVESDAIGRGCNFMFSFQRENGAFCRRRRISGRGEVWQENPSPCTHARIVRFMLQFGYGQDPRVRIAINWLLPRQRDDGMWFCRDAGMRGCLRATHDVIRLAALDAQVASHPAIAQATRVVCDLLMEPRMSRFHIGERWGTWRCLKFPYFGFSVFSALDALARLGFTRDEPKVLDAISYLLDRQRPDGTWPLDERWPRAPIDIGDEGKPNKWITLDALRVIKLLYTT